MDHLVDLDSAASQIAFRRTSCVDHGLAVDATTWRDGAGIWPQRLESDRSLVVDPDSVGVRIEGPGDSEAEAVLFRGAWADVLGITTTGELINEAPDVASSDEFGRVLDNLVLRAFGVA